MVWTTVLAYLIIIEYWFMVLVFGWACQSRLSALIEIIYKYII